MILKFDHISYISKRSDKNTLLKDKGEPLFSEISLRNIENKIPLMRNPQDNHDLYFYDGRIPTEYIFYDRVCEESKIDIHDGMIVGHYSNMEETVAFLNYFFPKKVLIEDGIIKCNLKGIIDKCDYFLLLIYQESLIQEKTYLDTAGYGVPALIYNGKLEKNNFCTDENSLIVNGKEMNIIFARCMYTDIIFELIRLSNN